MSLSVTMIRFHQVSFLDGPAPFSPCVDWCCAFSCCSTCIIARSASNASSGASSIEASCLASDICSNNLSSLRSTSSTMVGLLFSVAVVLRALETRCAYKCSSVGDGDGLMRSLLTRYSKCWEPLSAAICQHTKRIGRTSNQPRQWDHPRYTR